jgi:hypothetical protein
VKKANSARLISAAALAEQRLALPRPVFLQFHWSSPPCSAGSSSRKKPLRTRTPDDSRIDQLVNDALDAAAG